MNTSNYNANGGSWSDWFGIGGYAANYEPAIVRSRLDRGYVFVIGGNKPGLGGRLASRRKSDWSGHWDQLATLPGGNTASDGANAISAVLRGGNNIFDDWTIDLVVLASNQTVWHMAFDVSNWTGSWEQVPSTTRATRPSASGPRARTATRSTSSRHRPSAPRSSPPRARARGSACRYPRERRRAALPASHLRQPQSASSTSTRRSPAGTIYHDHYGPNPNLQGGRTYCH